MYQFVTGAGQWGAPQAQPNMFGSQMPDMGIPTPVGGSFGSQATDPHAFIKANYLHSDEAGSTRKIWDEARRQGWSNEQLGAGLGFNGQQVQDHFAKYGLGVQQPAAQPPMGPSMPPPASQMPYQPQQSQNPYLGGIADDMSRRMGNFLQDNLSGIRSNAILAGGFGGSRQGIAEGKAISGAGDALAGQMANLFGQSYNQDMNRGLQKYQGDQQFALGDYGNQTGRLGTVGGLMTNAFGADTQRIGTVGGLANQQQMADQNFYTQQRGQDLAQLGMGADIYSRGMQMPWDPVKNAAGTMQPYSGLNSSTSTGGGGQTGTNWGSVLGGAMAGAQLGKNFGWW